MGKIVYLMGKSSTGKDTIFKKLLYGGFFPFRKIVPYTTRPIREGEKEGVEYFFTDEAGFQKLSEQSKIIEERSYQTYHGLWRYFTVDDGIRLQRALNRERRQKNPKYEEMCRRFLADSVDFSEEKIRQAGIERCFCNDDLEKCLREITDYILCAGVKRKTK